MPQNYKAFIIGTSLTGKTTLIRYLRERTNLQIQEIDEEILRLNEGSWPKDDRYKHTVLAPRIKANVLSQENILFFTNANYFSQSDLMEARQKGFKIIQLFVDKEELDKRNKKRVENEGYEDHNRWFDSMLNYQKEIKEKGFVDFVIQTNKPVEKIAQELSEFLKLQF
jgi:guanylate kinase